MSPSTTYRDGGGPSKLTSKAQFGERAGASTAAVALTKPVCVQPPAKQAISTAAGARFRLMFLNHTNPRDAGWK